MNQPLPLSELLERLRRAGLPLGVDDHAAVQRLLGLEQRWDLEQLQLVLRATLARSLEEQAVFDEVFEAWAWQGHASAVAPPPPKPAEPTRWWRGLWQRQGAKAWLLAAMALALIVGTGIAWWLQRGAPAIEVAESPPPPQEEVQEPPALEQDLDDALTLLEQAEPEAPEQVQAAEILEPEEAATTQPADLALPTVALAGLLLLAAFLVGLRRPVPGELSPPYRFRLRLQSQGPPPLPDLQQLEDLAANLNVTPSREQSRRLDIDRTVAATIARAGLPSPVFERAPPSPHYLVLLDRDSGAVAGWVEQLFERLRRAGVRVDTYRYRGMPIALEAARSGRRTKLAGLAAGRFDALVVVGRAQAAFDASRDQLASWTASLQRFPDRTWFETSLPEHWDDSARQLVRETGTPVVPISLNALRLAQPGESALRLDDVDPPWPWLCDEAPSSDLALERLEAWLGTAWPLFTALAALPEPCAEQAFWLAERFFPQLTASDLLRLLMTPVLQRGRWPGAMRAAVADRLASQRPELAAQVRAAVGSAMTDQEPPAGSAAHLRWRLLGAEERLHFDPPAAAQELDQLRREHGEANPMVEESEPLGAWAAHADLDPAEGEAAPRPWDWLPIPIVGGLLLWFGVSFVGLAHQLPWVAAAWALALMVLFAGAFMELCGFAIATLRGRAWAPLRRAVGWLRMELWAVVLAVGVCITLFVVPGSDALLALFSQLTRAHPPDLGELGSFEPTWVGVVAGALWAALVVGFESLRCSRIRRGPRVSRDPETRRRRTVWILDRRAGDSWSPLEWTRALVTLALPFATCLMGGLALGPDLFFPAGILLGYAGTRLCRELTGRGEPVRAGPCSEHAALDSGGILRLTLVEGPQTPGRALVRLLTGCLMFLSVGVTIFVLLPFVVVFSEELQLGSLGIFMAAAFVHWGRRWWLGWRLGRRLRSFRASPPKSSTHSDPPEAPRQPSSSTHTDERRDALEVITASPLEQTRALQRYLAVLAMVALCFAALVAFVPAVEPASTEDGEPVALDFDIIGLHVAAHSPGDSGSPSPILDASTWPPEGTTLTFSIGQGEPGMLWLYHEGPNELTQLIGSTIEDVPVHTMDGSILRTLEGRIVHKTIPGEPFAWDGQPQVLQSSDGLPLSVELPPTPGVNTFAVFVSSSETFMKSGPDFLGGNLPTSSPADDPSAWSRLREAYDLEFEQVGVFRIEIETKVGHSREPGSPVEIDVSSKLRLYVFDGRVPQTDAGRNCQYFVSEAGLLAHFIPSRGLVKFTADGTPGSHECRTDTYLPKYEGSCSAILIRCSEQGDSAQDLEALDTRAKPFPIRASATEGGGALVVHFEVDDRAFVNIYTTSGTRVDTVLESMDAADKVAFATGDGGYQLVTLEPAVAVVSSPTPQPDLGLAMIELTRNEIDEESLRRDLSRHCPQCDLALFGEKTPTNESDLEAPSDTPTGTVIVEGNILTARLGHQDGSRHSPGEVPIGEYSLAVAFPGVQSFEGANILMRDFLDVQEGTTTTVRCDERAQTCRIVSETKASLEPTESAVLEASEAAMEGPGDEPSPLEDVGAEPEATGPGFLVVVSDSYAMVYMGGRRLGGTPIARMELDPGTYAVRAVCRDTGESKTIQVEIEPDELTTASFQFELFQP